MVFSRLHQMLLLLLGAMLGACATQPAIPSPEPFFNDALFATSSIRSGADEVFALNDAMQKYLRMDMAHQIRNDGPVRGLINALQRSDQLRLDYDSTRTLNAAEAFDARRGNCLSLVIMTAAFAKALDLQVTYQIVATEETWSRRDDLAFSNTHVNLTLGKRAMHTAPGYDESRLLTIDFLPAEYILGQRTRPIPEATIVAMYMNNRAAEALAQGQVDDAYWWARGAVLRAPDFTSSYNTLGVVYLHHGDLHAAERVFRHLLDAEPQDRQALSNLATALDKLGRTDESRDTRARLERIEPHPPYHFFRLGTAAMQRGDYRAARSLFEQEVARADYSSEFHFWLGLANLRLGDIDEARKQLALAVDYSTARSEHDLYAAKLDRLRDHTVR
jgi:Tfp pilus assembly protein PilF